MVKPMTVDNTGRFEVTDPAAEYLETIALLQDEISRLENELLSREDTVNRDSDMVRPRDDRDESDLQAMRSELHRLESELAGRDETINLLMEQLRLVEEAESASRDEWEQLAGWVAEVERRVELQDVGEDNGLRFELEAQRKQAEELRGQAEHQRTTWNHQRLAYEKEIERLRGLIAESSGGSTNSHAALEVLETENRRLRKYYEELEQSLETQSDSWRDRQEKLTQVLTETRTQLSQVQDDRQRERREFEAEIASLRSQLSRASLVQGQAAPVETREVKGGDDSIALEVDMRIRAFRQHLQEIHNHESETKNQNRLNLRLSRLWSRTGPK